MSDQAASEEISGDELARQALQDVRETRAVAGHQMAADLMRDYIEMGIIQPIRHPDAPEAGS